MDGSPVSPAHSQLSDGRGKASRGNQPRVSTLSASMAKATLVRELANQKKADLKVGAEWNEALKVQENRNDPEQNERLWGEIKTRLIRRYNTIQSAFKHIDSSGDGSISNIEFSNMLQDINLPLDPRVCRGVFAQASGGDRALSMGELKKLLMAKTIRKLKFMMDNFNGKQERVQTHMHNVLQCLAEADDSSRTRGVDRFQRKLTIPFCRDLWQALLKSVRKPPSHNLAVERPLLKKVIHEWIGIRLQGYESNFVMRIFDRIDCAKRGSVNLNSLITQLVLLSQEQDKGQKIALIFEMFDTDYDGCLLYDEIRAMFRCICVQRPIAEASAQSSRDVAFQEELSSQEGLRAYERARWYLQRSCKVEGGIVTLSELWESLSMQPSVLNDLIPGVVRIRWAMEPSSVEESLEDAPPQSREKRPLQLRRTATDPMPSIAMGERRKGSKLVGATWGAGGHKPAAIALSASIVGFSRGQSRGETPGSRNGTEAYRFKKSVMSKFQTSLRNFGDQRLLELTSGEVPRMLDQSADSSPPPSPRGGSSCRMPRIASAPPNTLGLGAGVTPKSSHGAGKGAGSANSPRGSIDLPPIGVPIIPGDKWGGEAADRFRLFCTVKNSFGKHAPTNVDAGIGIGYRCQLCRHFHQINTSCTAE